MRHTPMLFLLCLAFAGGCEIRSSRTVIGPPSHGAADSGAKGGSRPILDTSMLSLKSFHSVAVEDLLSQPWDMEDADRPHWDELFWDSAANKRKYPGLSLFRDFSFTENARCGIKMGRWKLNKAIRTMELDFEDGSKKNLLIQEMSLSQLVLIWQKGEDPYTMKFSADGWIHKRSLEDPFYPANNNWRLKPSKPEDLEQLHRRLKNFVHFYALFFKDNYQRRQTDISFIGLPSCFVWYNGGIGMSPAIELDKKWIACFYSEEQAMQGYTILSDLIGRHELKWPDHADSWVSETQSVLEQMATKL
jgi:hypothetical protein